MTAATSAATAWTEIVQGRWRGVRHWDHATAQQAAALLELAAATRWRTVDLDSDEADGKDGFLQACSDAFALPEWFGMNWDALEECLIDLDLTGCAGVLVVWQGWADFAESDPDAMATALDVLAAVVDGWSDDGMPGCILVCSRDAADRGSTAAR